MAHSAAMTPPLICVIEDEQVIAAAVAARLRAEGFSVEVAHDGIAGVALCERVRPDLVVLDLMLPGLDGLEVCRRVQRGRPVPVLMLTARDDDLRRLGQLHERVAAVVLRVLDRRARPGPVEHRVDEQLQAAELEPQRGVADQAEVHSSCTVSARRPSPLCTRGWHTRPP